MSPETLCTFAVPSRSEPTRTSPETELIVTEPSTDSASTSPETDCTFRSPVTRARRTSPLTVFTRPSPSSSPLTRTSPEALFARRPANVPSSVASPDAVATSTWLRAGTRACTWSDPSKRSKKPAKSFRSSATTSRLPASSIVVASTSFCGPLTSTVDSPPSVVSISTSPDGILISSRTGSGVAKACSFMVELLSAAAEAGKTVAAAAAGRTRREQPVERLHEPGVERDSVRGGRRLEPGLQGLRQPERDARAENLVGCLGRLPLGLVDVDELRIAARDPPLDPAALELRVELERRLGERLLEAPAERGLERDRQQVGRARGRVVTDRGHP